MAMIENIRKRRGLLIFIIGLGMLLFLVNDGIMNLVGGSPGSESYGEFNGTTLDRTSYQNMVNSFANCDLYQNDEQAERAAWNNLSEKTVYGPEIEEAGYQIGPDEFEDIMYGNNVSDWVKSVYYRNQNPSPEIITSTQNYFDGTLVPSKRATQYDLITYEYNKQKVEKLIKSGFYANTLDAERDFLSKEDKVKIELVAVKYANISDSLVTVTDGDVRSYYNAHKNDIQYKQNPFREVSLVKYEVLPTQQDSSMIIKRLDDLKGKWASAENDSTWLVNNGFAYNDAAYTPGTLAGETDSLLINSSIGSIVGPYVEKGAYKFSKIIRKDRVVNEAKGRHIFLSAGFRETDSVKVIADSLKQLLDDGASFNSLASKWSQDDSTSNAGGSLGWIKVEELKTATTGKQVKQLITDAEKGKTYVANVPGGFSIYEATDFRYDGIESVLASMTEEILASRETKSAQFNIVRELPLNYSNGEDLLAHLDEEGKSIEVKKIFQTASKRAISGIANSEKISGWAYRSTTDLNDVSEVIAVGDDFYIAVLTQIQDDKVPNYSVVEDKMREGALKQAKYDYIAKLMTTGDLANASLDEIHKGIEGAEKKTVTVRANNNNIAAVGGNEGLTVGAALGTPVDVIPKNPVQGEDAVILYQVKEFTYAELKTNYAEEQGNLQKTLDGYATRVRTTAQSKLVQDFRYKF